MARLAKDGLKFSLNVAMSLWLFVLRKFVVLAKLADLDELPPSRLVVRRRNLSALTSDPVELVREVVDIVVPRPHWLLTGRKPGADQSWMHCKNAFATAMSRAKF